MAAIEVNAFTQHPSIKSYTFRLLAVCLVSRRAAPLNSIMKRLRSKFLFSFFFSVFAESFVFDVYANGVSLATINGCRSCRVAAAVRFICSVVVGIDDDSSCHILALSQINDTYEPARMRKVQT